nr:origin recognition complex subunit 1 isoform X2 [Parasteatoda tepidariorum]
MGPRTKPKKLQARECRLLQDFIIPSLKDRRFGSRLEWDHEVAKVFCIRWIHKSSRNWTTEDSDVFVAWDKMKGRQAPLSHQDHVNSKQRLRAALRNIKNVKEVSCRDGYRKYSFADLPLEVYQTQIVQPGKNVQDANTCMNSKPREKRISSKSKVLSATKENDTIKSVSPSEPPPGTELKSDVSCTEKNKNVEKKHTNNFSEQALDENLWLPQRILRPRKAKPNMTQNEKELDELIGPELPIKKNSRKGNRKKEQDLSYKCNMNHNFYCPSPLPMNSNENNCLSAIQDHDYFLKDNDKHSNRVTTLSSDKIDFKVTKKTLDRKKNITLLVENIGNDCGTTSVGEKNLDLPVDNDKSYETAKEEENKFTFAVDLNNSCYQSKVQAKINNTTFVGDKNLARSDSALKNENKKVNFIENKKQKRAQKTKKNSLEGHGKKHVHENNKTCKNTECFLTESGISENDKPCDSEDVNVTAKQQIWHKIKNPHQHENMINTFKSSDGWNSECVKFTKDNNALNQRKWYEVIGTEEHSKMESAESQKLKNEMKREEINDFEPQPQNEVIFLNEIKTENKEPYFPAPNFDADVMFDCFDDDSQGFTNIKIPEAGNQDINDYTLNDMDKKEIVKNEPVDVMNSNYVDVKTDFSSKAYNDYSSLLSAGSLMKCIEEFPQEFMELL